MSQLSILHRATRAKAHLLVVDDNAAMRALLKGILTDEGLSVELASSAAMARQALRDRGDHFDIVVSDINMPLESGFDLLQWIKSDASGLSDMPVLLTTAELPDAESRLRGLALGAVDYVVRPVDLREFALRVLHAVESHQRMRLLQKALQDSQSLAMVGRLFAASNHEIKNLATIVGVTADQVARLVEVRLSDLQPRESESIQALRDSAGLLVDVARHISDLLDPMAQALKGPIDLSSVVRHVIGMMRARVRPILLEADEHSCPEGVWALGHDLRVKQVLINVILNAVDAIHELSPSLSGLIQVGWGSDDSGCFIVVKDNGIGMADPGVKSDFTAFSTTKKLRGGQGLGLWLCARLLENVGGHLTLASEGVGKGVIARVTLKKASIHDRSVAPSDLEQYFLSQDEL